MIIKIANLSFKISPRFFDGEVFFQDYIVGESCVYDIDIVITEEDMEVERGFAEPGNLSNLGLLEKIAIFRKICLKVLEHDAFFLHSSVVVVDDKAYAFAAKSGTGKSTHTNLWLDSNYDLLDEWYIIELIEKGWDVVIGGDFILDEESLATMELMKSELEERDIFLNNIYYVDNLSLTASQQNEVLELGFDGYAQITKYTTTINSQTLENGLYQLEYAPFFYGENKLGTLLGLVVDQDAGYIVSIDAVVDEEDEKTNVNISNIRLESLLDLVTEYEEEGTMQVQILSEQIEYKNNMESAYSEELLIYEEAIVDVDCAIEELQAERDAVYAQWRLEEEEIEEGLR